MLSLFARNSLPLPMATAAVCLFMAITAHSQRAAVSIRDLVRLPSTKTSVEWPLGERGEDYSTLRGWHIEGEQWLLRPPLPPLTPELAVRLLAGRLQLKAADLPLEHGHLMVAPGDAPAVREAVQDLRALVLAERVELELRLEQKRGETWTVLSSGSGLSRGGSLVRISDTVRRSRAFDYSVEVAQSAGIGDPEIQAFADGAAVLARARVVPGTSLAVLELMAGDHQLESGARVELGSEQLGPLDRIVAKESRGAFVTILQQGKASVHEWSDADGREMRLSARGTWKPAPLLTQGSVLASTLLASDATSFAWRKGLCEDEEELSDLRLHELDLLTAKLTTGLPRSALTDYWEPEEASLRVLRLHGSVERQLSRLEETLATMTASFELEVDLVACAADTVLGDGAELPKGARRLSRVRTRLLTSRGASFVAMASKSFLADWYVEVAEAMRFADPVFAMAHQGVAINALGTCEPGGERVELQLGLRVLGVRWDDAIDVRMAGDALAPGSIDAEEQAQPAKGAKEEAAAPPRTVVARLLPAVVGKIEKPEQASKSMSYELALERGKPRILRCSAAIAAEQAKDARRLPSPSRHPAKARSPARAPIPTSTGPP